MPRQIIGILGGMGPEATRDLYSNIIAQTPAQKDQDHLRIIIDNNPQVPDRTAALLSGGPDPVPAMARSARLLAGAGADFIIIPCVSAHAFLDRLQPESPIPILSAFEAVARAAMDIPQVRTLGLLATSGTIRAGRFEEVLKNKGFALCNPQEAIQESVMDAIYTIKADPSGNRRTECLEKLKAAADHLIDRGAQGIIAGCTEIPLVLKKGDLSVPLFDVLWILASAAVRQAWPEAQGLNHQEP